MSLTRLQNRIEHVLESGERLFIPYVMSGDGGFEQTEKLIRLLESSGASVIEIGVPFSDPIADGPVIQAAGQRALDGGTTLKNILDFLKQTPIEHEVPRVIMSYLNPIFQYGLSLFFEDLTEAGISGLILPDLPFEEFDMILPYAQAHDIALIPLVAPSTSLERMQMILGKASGFVYTVTVNGTTGQRTSFDRSLTSRLAEIKQTTRLPVVAGFGISSREQADALGVHCDGVVMGSKIVELARNQAWDEITSLVSRT